MTIRELNALTEWVDQEIVAANVPQTYQALANALQHNIQGQQQQPFDEQREALLELLGDVPVEGLDFEQQRMLDKMGILKCVGDSAVRDIEDTLYRNVIDIATAHQRISEMMQSVTNGVKKNDQIKAAFKGLVEPPSEVSEIARIKVRFAGNAALGNLSDLRQWANEWFEIGRGIALAEGRAPEEISIIGTSEGSIIVILGVAYGMAKIISVIILKALEAAERYLEIKKKAQEIRALELSNAKIEAEIEKEAEQYHEKARAQIVEDLLQGRSDRKADGEVRNALERSVSKLLLFIERGGEVDCYLPEPEESEVDDSELEDGEAAQRQPDSAQLRENVRENFERIREIEERVRLLEHYESNKEEDAQ
jgi:hypothetical protein